MCCLCRPWLEEFNRQVVQAGSSCRRRPARRTSLTRQAGGSRLGHRQQRRQSTERYGARGLFPSRSRLDSGGAPHLHHEIPPREPRRAALPHVSGNPPRNGEHPDTGDIYRIHSIYLRVWQPRGSWLASIDCTLSICLRSWTSAF